MCIFKLACCSWLMVNFVLLVTIQFGCVSGSTHWKITETGRIESRENSIFTLLRPYDLASFLKQGERVNRLESLKRFITARDVISKREHAKQIGSVSVSNFQETFYKTDTDCIKAGQQLTKFSFYETYFINWPMFGLGLPKESLDIKRSNVKVFKKPNCNVAELPFSMRTFDHLDSIQSKENITMPPEFDLLKNIFVEPEDFYGHLIYTALSTNSTSWVYLTMASDFFRIKGDYSNSIKCLQRAIYYVPKKYQHIPKLSLSNLIHKLNFINDSLSVALADLSNNFDNSILAYFIGNIYVTLGELNQAQNWYNRAFELDPKFNIAHLKKHAVICHLKLEDYLESQHDNLQRKLEELKDYQSFSDEWFALVTKFELEKSSPNRKDITKNSFYDFHTKTKSIICDWKKEESEYDLQCKHLDIHYSYFSFDYLNVSYIVSNINQVNENLRNLKDDYINDQKNQKSSELTEKRLYCIRETEDCKQPTKIVHPRFDSLDNPSDENTSSNDQLKNDPFFHQRKNDPHDNNHSLDNLIHKEKSIRVKIKPPNTDTDK